MPSRHEETMRMIYPTTDELRALMRDLESDRVERKSSWTGSAKDKALRSICAFANDLPDHRKPGYLIIGVDDAGSPTNLVVDDRMLTTLGEIHSDGRIVPPISLGVQKYRIDDCDVAVACVRPSDTPPVLFEGRVWVRVGPRVVQANQQDERVLSEKRRHLDKTFDAHPLRGSTMEGDLHIRRFSENYLPRAIDRQTLIDNGRSTAERLASLAFIASVDDPTPTLTGLLTVGVSPRTWIAGAYVQFIRIAGTTPEDPVIDQAEIDGDMETLITRLDDKLRASITVSADFRAGTLREETIANIPLTALQQTTRNAVMHRTYEGTNTPIRVEWYDDRVEIVSPGGPFGTVTQENFGRAGFTDYRNPNIATVMKNLGFVQRFGFGISETRRAMRENGNPPPMFDVSLYGVRVVLRTI